MALLFISNIVPDRAPYNAAGFTRSGNNVLLGIANSLPTEEPATLISCRPIASFPNGPLWIKSEIVSLDDNKQVLILPTLNIKIFKNILWGFCIKRYISKWAKEHAGEVRNVLIYNIYTPPVSSVYKACKKYGCKLYGILYDLGVPPKNLKLSKLTMLGYRYMERMAMKYIRLLSGRIVINESIVEHYAPSEDYLLIDGGVNNNVIANLFPLEESKTNDYVLVLAGMLWSQNGTGLLLKTLEQYPDLPVTVYFAGDGIDVPIIKKAAEQDSRIHYAGMLKPAALFELYQKADILLNLRLEEEVDFHFPSKLLEYLSTGKHVVSTSVAHAERDYGDYMTILHDRTPDVLAETLINVMKQGKKQLYEQGVRAREFMLKSRTWQARTDEILKYMKSKENVGE